MARLEKRARKEEMSRFNADHLSLDEMPEALRPQLQESNRRERFWDHVRFYWPWFLILVLAVFLAALWARTDANRDPAAGYEAAETLRAVNE
jgi:hypothetical protein